MIFNLVYMSGRFEGREIDCDSESRRYESGGRASSKN